jgi:radical SAM superfamily enzyme YgiQ (UPF0313 family)
VEKVGRHGVKQLKLYFMTGLPTETDKDIEEMAHLVMKCKTIMDRQLTGSRITLTIAPFVPKAGTPFQRQGMESMSVLKYRLTLLKKRLTIKGIRVKNESLDWSEVQAALSRGDTKLTEALAQMDRASLAEWRRVMKLTQLDIDFYAHAKWDVKQKLPWQMIET